MPRCGSRRRVCRVDLTLVSPTDVRIGCRRRCRSRTQCFLMCLVRCLLGRRRRRWRCLIRCWWVVSILRCRRRRRWCLEQRDASGGSFCVVGVWFGGADGVRTMRCRPRRRWRWVCLRIELDPSLLTGQHRGGERGQRDWVCRVCWRRIWRCRVRWGCRWVLDRSS